MNEYMRAAEEKLRQEAQNRKPKTGMLILGAAVGSAVVIFAVVIVFVLISHFEEKPMDSDELAASVEAIHPSIKLTVWSEAEEAARLDGMLQQDAAREQANPERSQTEKAMIRGAVSRNLQVEYGKIQQRHEVTQQQFDLILKQGDDPEIRKAWKAGANPNTAQP